jgi:hypothetical protein
MRIWIISTALMLASIVSNAQENFFSVTYGMGLPTAETGDFIDDYSWRGVNLEWKKMVKSNVGVGFTTGWNVFDDYVNKGSYTDGTTTYTANQYRYINVFPVMANVTYYLDPDASVIPFGTIGAGTYRILQRNEFGPLLIEEKNWHFGFYPEVGVILPTYGSVDFFFSTRYNYAFKAGDARWDQSYLGFNIGISYWH